MADYTSSAIYGEAGWPYIEAGGWPNRTEPVTSAELQLVLPGGGPPGPTVSTRNRVWDTVAGGFHVWVTTNGADPTGLQYDGPGTYGVNTSNYSVI